MVASINWYLLLGIIGQNYRGDVPTDGGRRSEDVRNTAKKDCYFFPFATSKRQDTYVGELHSFLRISFINRNRSDSHAMLVKNLEMFLFRVLDVP